MGPSGTYHSASDPELPASIILSGYFKTAPQWATTATVKYTLWHRFHVFPGKTTSKIKNGNLNVDYRWKDSWTISLGQEYYMNENWTLRAGTAWDQSPSANNYYRSNRIPDTDRVWYSAGLSYQYNEHLSFNMAYTYMYAHKSHLDTSLTGNAGMNATADYTNSIKVFAFGFNYAF